MQNETSEPVKIIEAEYSLRRELLQLFSYRNVLYELALRQIRILYKQTVLGVFWVFLQPVIFALIIAAIFSGFVRFETEVSYPLFVLSALISWVFMSRAVGEGTNSLLRERHLVTKVYFPRLIIPLSFLLAAVFDLIVAYTIILPFIFYSIGGISSKFLLFPVFLAFLLLLALGLVAFTSSLNAIYRDFGILIGFFLQMWMYLSPIIYPANIFKGKWEYVYALNPLVGILEAIRWSLFPGYSWPGWQLTIALVEIFLLLVGGLYTFAKLEAKLVDTI